jgi:hypothetical protein
MHPVTDVPALLQARRGGDLQRVETAAAALDALPAAGTERAAEICVLDDALDSRSSG